MDTNAIGYLIVNVRYANGASPVVNARIVLKRGNETLGEYITGLDGKTETITLQMANNYMINVYADGFIESEYGDIPIMQNITTIQNVGMFPLYNYPVEAEI